MKSKEQASGKWQLDLFGLLCDAKAFTKRERERERTKEEEDGDKDRKEDSACKYNASAAQQGKLPKRQHCDIGREYE